MKFTEKEVYSYLHHYIQDPICIKEIILQLPENNLHVLTDLNPIVCDILSAQSLRNRTYDSIISQLIKEDHFRKTQNSFVQTMIRLQTNEDSLGNSRPLLDPHFFQFILDHQELVDTKFLEYNQEADDYPFTPFGWKTLLNNYLIKTHEGIQERPNHLWFRISLFLYRDDWSKTRDSFIYLKKGYFIHATPTLFHAGLQRCQMASCFLMGTEDSVSGIYKTIGDAAQISKWAGGIGVHISSIRGKNSYISGTNGFSNGIMPMLKVYNDTSRYIDQGGGKRNGAFAIYLEPWHSDIFDFICAKRNTGSEEERARDLFYALWIPDLFMKQVSNDLDWYLMSSSACGDLTEVWGDAFEKKYWDYVEKGLFIQKIKARDLWNEILKSQMETGTPYMLYKDSCNKKSNQQNLGTIRSSNLCCEIIEYSDEKEYAVCNLASIALPRFLKNPKWNRDHNFLIFGKQGCAYCMLLKHILDQRNIKYSYSEKNLSLSKSTYPVVFIDDECVGGFTEMWEQYLCPEFDFVEFGKVVERIVENLNRVIDLNHYPLEECKRSNLKHRPIGLGVQGLADVFFAMRLPYDSEKARILNRKIFEAMYFHALSSSNLLAQQNSPYESFQGSPLSKGLFHFDLCEDFKDFYCSGSFDWNELRNRIKIYGTRNSLLVAPMPTASTSQILGNTESFEPLTNNLYLRRTLAGEFYVCNQFLLSDLQALDLWKEDIIDTLIVQKGSVQQLPLPSFLKQVYRTVWEIPQKSLIEMAADRQFFIDQSQSFNIYLNETSNEKLTKIHFYGWQKGLKTGSYYVRSRSAISSQNVTIDPTKEKHILDCESCTS